MVEQPQLALGIGELRKPVVQLALEFDVAAATGIERLDLLNARVFDFPVAIALINFAPA